MFQQPSQGDKVVISELVGSLVLIWVHGVREGIPTPYGEKEAVACDIHVLDGPKGGEKFENALIFQGALIGSLRGAAGSDPVLARIGQGIAKPGQSAPFVLLEFTEADAAIATGYIQRMPKPFQQAGTAGPTTPDPGATQDHRPPTASAPTSPGNGTSAIDLSALPPEVQELIKASLR